MLKCEADEANMRAVPAPAISKAAWVATDANATVESPTPIEHEAPDDEAAAQESSNRKSLYTTQIPNSTYKMPTEVP